MWFRLSWYCAVSCWFIVNACTRDEIVLIQLISNHGSTAPTKLYPTDPNKPIVWREGLGQLTMLGKFQPFALGRFLRARYSDFITSDPLEVEVHSSPAPESLVSAQSQVTALYAPTPEFEIVWKLPWQPMYIECHSEDEDKYFSTPYCSLAEEEYKRVLESPEAVKFNQKYRDLFDYWTIHSGWNIKDSETASRLYNTLQTEMNYNLIVPIWANRHWEELRFISEMSFYWKARTKQLRRLRGGPLVDLIVGKMMKKASGAFPEKKVFLYSTHEENIAAFLNSLSMFNGKKPPSSATVVAELYKHENKYFVRMLYMNSTTPEKEPQNLYLMNFEKCGEFCPLQHIVDYVKDLIPEDWEEECRVK